MAANESSYELLRLDTNGHIMVDANGQPLTITVPISELGIDISTPAGTLGIQPLEGYPGQSVLVSIQQDIGLASLAEAADMQCGREAGSGSVDSNTVSGANSSVEGEVDDDAAEEEGWTDSAIKALIVVRRDMDDMFQAPKSKKSKIWALVAKKIKEMTHNTNITGPSCDRKWRNLMQTLKKIKEKQKRSGRGKVVWRYYDMMIDATSGNVSIDPPTETLVSSIPDISDPVVPDQENGTDECGEAERQTEALCETDVKDSSKRERKVKKGNRSDDQEWLQKYLEERKAESSKRWEEARKLEEEKIQVMKSLVSAIMSKQ